MRVVTLDGLGAVAPIVPMGAPQYYGIRGVSGGLGEMTPSESKMLISGLGVGAALGSIVTYFLLRKKR